MSIAGDILAVSPEFSSASWWKSLVLYDNKEFQKAHVSLSEFITRMPDLAFAYKYRAEVNEALNNHEAANADMDKYNQLNK